MSEIKLRVKGINTPRPVELTNFITVWDTTVNDVEGELNPNPTIELPLRKSGVYNFSVNWGDGITETITEFDQAERQHTYAVGGVKTITITGTIEGWLFPAAGDATKLTQITNVGPLKLGNEGQYFAGCANLTSIGGVFDLTGTTNMSYMFSGCANLTSVNGIGSWNVSAVTDMSSMFEGTVAFNQSLNTWNVTSVTNMNGMFANTTAFNGDISEWDVSAVTDMSSMFAYTTAFNGDISDWDVSAVNYMGSMFAFTTAFNQSLNTWNVTSVNYMNSMFEGAVAFNGDISGWDVSAVTDMSYMFNSAVAFNGDISEWDVSAVTNMKSMFNSAEAFNGDISEWDVSAVTGMSSMFAYTTAFNGDISEWDVTSVTDMSSMFEGAVAFNQDISPWDVSAVTDMSGFMDGKSTADYDYYDNLLNAWSELDLYANGGLQNDVSWSMGAIEYTSAGATARQDIIDNYSWTITDGGLALSYLSYNVTYGGVINGVSSLSQNQINNIVAQTPTLILTRWTTPGSTMSNTNITSNSTLTQVGQPFVGVFTSNFNAADLLDILSDGAYYRISGGDNYGSNYSTLSPYFNGSSGAYYLKWNESTGEFYSAGATSSAGIQIFYDYAPGDALYNEIDPLIDVIGFRASPQKDK